MNNIKNKSSEKIKFFQKKLEGVTQVIIRLRSTHRATCAVGGSLAIISPTPNKLLIFICKQVL
jgi:RAB protein geranylgeranyltransferase component A